jgi:hypothetical protein
MVAPSQYLDEIRLFASQRGGIPVEKIKLHETKLCDHWKQVRQPLQRDRRDVNVQSSAYLNGQSTIVP